MKKTPTARTCRRSSRRIPFFTDGATYVDPRGKSVKAGLYLDANGPHPINSFGCTICHGGQGSGTDFTFASHTPDSLEQAEEWKKNHGWEDFHFWDFPMPPDRFIESSCLKCHTQVTDIPAGDQAPGRLPADRQVSAARAATPSAARGQAGPDLTDERQVGPNLSHIAAKDAKEWVVKWIANPHAFRPDSRMPRFYGADQQRRDRKTGPRTTPKSTRSRITSSPRARLPPDFTDPPATTDPAKGKELFLQKGCLACHQHRPYAEKTSSRPTSNRSTPPTSPTPLSRSTPRTSRPRSSRMPSPISARTSRTWPPSSRASRRA